MNIIIFLLFIGLGIILFYMSLRFREYLNASLVMGGFGAFLILMSGLFVLTIGVDYQVGTNMSEYVIDNVSVQDLQYSYSSLKGGLSGSYGLSYGLFFLAFALFLITYLGYSDDKNKVRNYSEEDDY